MITCFNNIVLMAVSRLPIFYIGVLVADLAQKKKKINGVFVYGGALIGIIILYTVVSRYSDYLWNYGLWWHPYIFIVPGLCSGMGHMFRIISKLPVLKLIYKGLDALGGYTFEIYLIHIAAFEIVSSAVNMQREKWFLLILASIVIAILYKKIVKKFSESLNGAYIRYKEINNAKKKDV